MSNWIASTHRRLAFAEIDDRAAAQAGAVPSGMAAEESADYQREVAVGESEVRGAESEIQAENDRPLEIYRRVREFGVCPDRDGPDDEYRSLPIALRRTPAKGGQPIDDVAATLVNECLLPEGSSLEDLRQILAERGDARRAGQKRFQLPADKDVASELGATDIEPDELLRPNSRGDHVAPASRDQRGADATEADDVRGLGASRRPEFVSGPASLLGKTVHSRTDLAEIAGPLDHPTLEQLRFIGGNDDNEVVAVRETASLHPGEAGVDVVRQGGDHHLGMTHRRSTSPVRHVAVPPIARSIPSITPSAPCEC